MTAAPLAANARSPRCSMGCPHPIRLLFSAKPWAAALFAALSFAIGTFWFVVLVSGIATGLGMLITFFGVPILLLTMWLWTVAARGERLRINLFFGTRLTAAYRGLSGPTWPAKLRSYLTDPTVWRDLAYMVLLFPVGIIEFVITMVVVTVPLALVTLPLYSWALPDGQAWSGRTISFERPDYQYQRGDAAAGGRPLLTEEIDLPAGPDASILGLDATSYPESVALALIGVPLLLLMPYALVGMGRAHVLLGRALLTSNREAELEERVDVLTVSRSRMMEAALAERRRIERDLHDGAQQRLVALAMDLGMAKIKLESDPEGAKKLVEDAHREAKLAMAEIRNLVQGIHPAVLTDRGLDAAISALAGRSPIPVGVIVDLDGRLPDAVESTAYFVVAESLTNVAKHSVATEAQVRVHLDGSRLVVEVSDNGVGGADADGAGLTGLAARVAALDGRLTVESPPGGGTRVRAEIPCGP